MKHLLPRIAAEGLGGSARTLLQWKIWQPLKRRLWRRGCRLRERAHPCDLSAGSWQAAICEPLPLDWYSPEFYVAQSPADPAAGLLREEPAAVAACLERCERIVAGDFTWLLAGSPLLGPLPDWNSLIQRPGSWPAGPSRDLDYLSEGRPGDIRLNWELNRHQYFQVLGRGWRLTRDARWSECFVRHLDDWITRNPCDTGPQWIQAQEVALRAISWCWAWHLFHDAPAFTPIVRQRMLQALSWHLRFLEREVCAFDKWTHNHLISELAGIHLLSVFFPQFKRAARLAGWSRRLLLREVEKQIWPDGMAGELSTAYMFFVLETLSAVLACQRESWRGTVLEQRVAAMGGAAAWLLRPDGSLPIIGDSDSGRGWLLTEELEQRAAAAQLPGLVRQEAGVPWIPARPAPEWRWLFHLGPAATETQARHGARTHLFRQAGIWCWREHEGADSSWLLFRGGATRRRRWVQQSHHHADLLSFEYSQGGRPLFIDPGTYAYGLETEQRRAFRSSQAHNGLWVEGWEPCDFRGLRFGVWDLPLSRYLEGGEGEEPEVAMAFSAGGVAHERRLRPCRDGFVLHDRIRRPADRRAGLGFQLAAGLTVEAGRRGWLFPQLGLELRVLSPELGLELEEGQLSRRYGQREPAPRLRIWLPAREECQVELELGAAR